MPIKTRGSTPEKSMVHFRLGERRWGSHSGSNAAEALTVWANLSDALLFSTKKVPKRHSNLEQVRHCLSSNKIERPSPTDQFPVLFTQVEERSTTTQLDTMLRVTYTILRFSHLCRFRFLPECLGLSRCLKVCQRKRWHHARPKCIVVVCDLVFFGPTYDKGLVGVIRVMLAPFM
jgi:hypothetical protein